MLDQDQLADKIVRTANAIIVVLDAHGSIQLFNLSAEELTGYSSTEVLGKNWIELFIPRDKRLGAVSDH